MSAKAYRDLVAYLRETALLESCSGLLGWDQEVCMPRRGAPQRAQKLALLAGMVHRRYAAKRLRNLVERARPFAEVQGEGSAEEANVREAARLHDRATRVPAALAEERAHVTTLARRAWVEARQCADYSLFRPWLEKVLDLTRRRADALGYAEHPYDALLDEFEPGETAARLRGIFRPLAQALADLLRRIRAAAPLDTSCLAGTYPAPRQRLLAREMAEAVGFDFDGGRLDDSVHPFCSGIGPGDVRLTSRWNEARPMDGLLSALHEAGHGLYEQGLPAEDHGTPAGDSCSLGVHESQSRLWENFVGRSRGFWEHFLPRWREVFPGAPAPAEPDGFYRAVNEAKSSFIRSDADEVTYNLHIFLRLELELELLEGKLPVTDVPRAWNERFEASLGIAPPDDALGCLQDVHWSAGMLAYFPTYTLGNLYAAQLWEKAREDLGDLDAAFSRGEFAPLLAWLREKVHRQGRRHAPRRLVERATGRPLAAEPLLSHLETRYGAVYGL